MSTLTFTPAIWSRKSTPLDLREYVIDGYGATGPCGCMKECYEYASKKGYDKVVFKTLEGTKITKVVQ